MKIEQRIAAFDRLGERLKSFLKGEEDHKLSHVITQSYIRNGWFIERFVKKALEGLAINLENEKLEKWVSSYNFTAERKKVGVIMPGNIPAAGFFDAMCVLISGNDLVAKTSTDDEVLIRTLLDILCEEEPAFRERISYGDFRSIKPDAVIATGSDNTSRYFEYYFSKFPNIIRKNRNSVAVLTGDESKEELDLLADDVFIYFGLGCRNVSKIFIPAGFDRDRLFNAFFKYSWVAENKKYANNYDYNKTILILNNEQLLENGFLLMKNDSGLDSPMATINVEEYERLDDVAARLENESSKLQCIVTNSEKIKDKVPFGEAQTPGLTDYPDKVDVLRFLETI